MGDFFILYFRFFIFIYWSSMGWFMIRTKENIMYCFVEPSLIAFQGSKLRYDLFFGTYKIQLCIVTIVWTLKYIVPLTQLYILSLQRFMCFTSQFTITIFILFCALIWFGNCIRLILQSMIYKKIERNYLCFFFKLKKVLCFINRLKLACI